MIDISQALSLVLSRAQPNRPQHVPLAAALGRVLAEDVASDVDSPPHDKSMVDGYAIVASDLAGMQKLLEAWWTSLTSVESQEAAVRSQEAGIRDQETADTR